MTRRLSTESVSSVATILPTENAANESGRSDEEEFHLPDDLQELDHLYEEKIQLIEPVAAEFQALNKLANELIDLKVRELQLKTRAVLCETDPDYRAHVVTLRNRCQRRTDAAAIRLSLRLRSIQEIGHANELLEHLQAEHAKARARQEVFCKILTELEKVLSERMLTKLSKLRRVQRRAFHKLRTAYEDLEAEEDIAGNSSDREKSPPKKAIERPTPLCPFIVYTLKPHEIEEDLRAIQQSLLFQSSAASIDLYPEVEPVLQADCGQAMGTDDSTDCPAQCSHPEDPRSENLIGM